MRGKPRCKHWIPFPARRCLSNAQSTVALPLNLITDWKKQLFERAVRGFAVEASVAPMAD